LTNRKIAIMWFVILALAAATLVACGPATPPAEEATANESSATAEGESTGSTQDSVPEPPAAEFDLFGGAAEADVITTDSGLRYLVFEEGDGPKPDEGQVVMVHYTGYLLDGTVFDSSVNRGQPFGFPLGQGNVIAGWDEGIALLNQGSRARLIIPSDLGYGELGAGERIPPGATLVFDVELVDILAGAPDSPEEIAEEEYTEAESGLLYYDLVVGDGEAVQTGQQVLIHYTGWLEDGFMFDSSLDHGQPVSFIFGIGQVIPGWDVGLEGMQEGGMRQMIIPSELAFGEEGAGGGIIPPNASLIFQIELVEVLELDGS
jgi:peptidylprolyl isomerase